MCGDEVASLLSPGTSKLVTSSIVTGDHPRSIRLTIRENWRQLNTRARQYEAGVGVRGTSQPTSTRGSSANSSPASRTPIDWLRTAPRRSNHCYGGSSGHPNFVEAA